MSYDSYEQRSTDELCSVECSIITIVTQARFHLCSKPNDHSSSRTEHPVSPLTPHSIARIIVASNSVQESDSIGGCVIRIMAVSLGSELKTHNMICTLRALVPDSPGSLSRNQDLTISAGQSDGIEGSVVKATKAF